MRHVNGVYTQRHNRLKKTDGSLFRGRYKAILVDSDEYLLHLSRYIHRNPIEARLIQHLSDYPWSSYPYYVGVCSNQHSWLYTKEVYEQLNVKRMVAKKYRDFVEMTENNEEIQAFYKKDRLPPILGDENFIVYAKSACGEFVDENTYFERQSLRPSIEEIVDIVAEACDVGHSEIYHSRKGRGVRNTARSMAMYVSQEVGGYRLSDIARAFSLVHYGGVSNAIYRFKKEMEKNVELCKTIKYIINRLDP